MVEKISKMIEKLELLKKAKKRYISESRKHPWHRIDLDNSLWLQTVQPVINKIEINLAKLWPCISENGSGKWTFNGIENAISSRKPDLMDALIQEFKIIRRGLEIKPQQHQKPAEIGGKDEGSKIMVTARTSKENWEAIRGEYDISKRDFGKKINFVSDSFKRKIIFRDVEHAFVLASQGYSKPALILAGGVIEELLRLYLQHKKIKSQNKRFVDYIQVCKDNKLLKRGVSSLTESIRDFRNLVHLENEETKRHTVSKATAKGAVSSIFTIANDFR